uniref:Capping protein regulator and myosin 1 linker 2 n=1 Tax=Aquila chrysaetos chrysaetos TaxID=223781 RepID=A0A663DZP6_AQUCH
MEARPFSPVVSGRIFLATLHTRVIAKHKVVGMLFSRPTAAHPSGLSPGHCSRTRPPTCMRGSGGFSETYAALCDYNGFAFREEIQWDVDNIYHSQDCREFNLLDFSHLESRDVALSIAALSFNLWFTKLSCKDFRLVSEISEQLLYMLSKSVMLEELVLENSGLKGAPALSPPPKTAAHCWGVLPPPRGWHGAAETGCAWGGGQPAQRCPTLCPLLRVGWGTRGSAGGRRKPQHGADPLSTPHTITHPSLGCARGHSTSLTRLISPPWQLFGALVHGCHASLVHLDLSKNVYSHKRVKTISPDIKEFFSQACALRHVSLAGTKLPADSLRSAGAQVIQDLIPDASSISDLDLSDNGFDPDMVTLVLSIGRSKSIRHVSLGKNFNIKSKEGLLDVLHRIVQLTQEDDCPLQSLSVAESRLKLGTNVLLSALGSNTSLIALDISGNAMGDTGAKMLAKALQINTKLRTVVWDRNNTTAHGLLEVAQALERNYTLKSMPLPMSDVAQAYRSNPEKTEEAVHKLQSCLMRNQLRRTLPAQTFRLQQGILTTSSEQMVNEICLSVQKHVDILSACPGREVEADIICAEEAIRNANLSVSVSPLRWETPQLTQLRFGTKAGYRLVNDIINRQSENTRIVNATDAVLDTAHSLCPAVVQKSGVRDQLVNAMSERIYLQDHLNLSVVLDQMVTDVFSKLKWVTYCLPSPMVAGDGGSGGGGSDDDDADGEAWRGWMPTGALSPFVGVSELEPAAGRDASGLRAHRAPPSLSPAAPPARPASTKDAEPASGSLPSTQPATAATAGSLMDLPTAGEKLEHCTKARPRPNRRHKQPPSKPNVQPVACENSEDRSITRVDEGLEDFFAKSPTAPETCLGSAPLAPSGSRTLKKKIGNFFAFKKPKSSRGSRCEKEPEGSSAAPRSRRSMLSDILRAPSKAGEAGKPLSKSEEGGLAAEPRAEPEHCQTPDSARRIRPKYSREGKSQSLILLSGEDEDALGVRHDKKRQLEKSEGELPASFEQRMQVMLHRIGVTKGPATEGKKPQLTDAGRWLVLAGDIVDNSADSPPSLKARTHSVSTGGSPVGAGGVSHQPPGQRARSPLQAPSSTTRGTEPMRTGRHGCPGARAGSHPREGALHPWVPNPRDGGQKPSTLPSPWGGCRLVPSTKSHPLGPSLLGTHSSALPSPQMHPSAARPPQWSPVLVWPSPGQPGKPWEDSCPPSCRAPAQTSPGTPSSCLSPACYQSPGPGKAGAAACHGQGGVRRRHCRGGSATAGRWVLVHPCPHHLTPKVGMRELSMLSPSHLLACSWSPLEMEGSRDPSTQCWVLMGGLLGGQGAAGSPLTATPHCFSRQPADATAGGTMGDQPPSCVRPRGAAQGA